MDSYYKFVTKMMLCILITCFFIPLSTYATDHTVTVGPGTVYIPQNLTVQQGDKIIWNFAGGMHDVVQTDGPAGSCQKSADPNAFASLVNPPTNTYSITINKTSGAYFYMCSVATHCQPGGMWGVITIGNTSSSSPGQPGGGATGASGPASTNPPKSLGTKNVTSNFAMIFIAVFTCILTLWSGILV